MHDKSWHTSTKFALSSFDEDDPQAVYQHGNSSVVIARHENFNQSL